MPRNFPPPEPAPVEGEGSGGGQYNLVCIIAHSTRHLILAPIGMDMGRLARLAGEVMPASRC